MVDFLTFASVYGCIRAKGVVIVQRQNKYLSHLCGKHMVSERHNYSYSHIMCVTDSKAIAVVEALYFHVY